MPPAKLTPSEVALLRAGPPPAPPKPRTNIMVDTATWAQYYKDAEDYEANAKARYDAAFQKYAKIEEYGQMVLSYHSESGQRVQQQYKSHDAQKHAQSREYYDRIADPKERQMYEALTSDAAAWAQQYGYDEIEAGGQTWLLWPGDSKNANFTGAARWVTPETFFALHMDTRWGYEGREWYDDVAATAKGFFTAETFKRAGVAAWKSNPLLGLDPEFLAAEFNDPKRAAQILDDFDAKDFGIDIAFMAGGEVVGAGLSKGVGAAVRHIRKVRGVTRETLGPQLTTGVAERQAQSLASAEKWALDTTEASRESAMRAFDDAVTDFDAKDHLAMFGDATAEAERAASQERLQRAFDRVEFSHNRVKWKVEEADQIGRWRYAKIRQGDAIGESQLLDQHESLTFASLTYAEPHERAALLRDASQKLEWAEGGRHWEYDDALSDEERGVFYDATNNTVHINHRGSQTADDFAADAYYLAGTFKKERYDRLMKIYEDVHAKYPYAVVEGSGQSLGGAEVQVAVDRFGLNSWFGHHEAINPLTSPMLRRRLQLSAYMKGARRTSSRAN